MRLASGLLGKIFGGLSKTLKFNQVKFARPVVTGQIDTPVTRHSRMMKAEVCQAVFTITHQQGNTKLF